MVTDCQMRRLMKLIQTEGTLAVAAAKAGMDEKTARKYRNSGRLPSQQRVQHTWRTRPDPFAEVWHEIEEKLNDNAGFGRDRVRGSVPDRACRRQWPMRWARN